MVLDNHEHLTPEYIHDYIIKVYGHIPISIDRVVDAWFVQLEELLIVIYYCVQDYRYMMREYSLTSTRPLFI